MLSTQTTNWKFSPLGGNIGAAGLNAIDLDNDGDLEIITGGSSSRDYWHILEFVEETESYEIQWTSEGYAEAITNIEIISPEDSSSDQIFVALENGDVYIYDGETLQEISRISTSNPVYQILRADIDNDSTDEIILGHEDKLLVLNADTFALEHEIDHGARDVKIGNVDQDAANEIVFSDGLILELNHDQSNVDWSYGDEFGTRILLSDIDDDGIEEIVAAADWEYITAYDADQQSPKWQLTTDQDIAALLIADINQDGQDEVIYGDGQWGGIYAYNPETLSQEWSVDNPEHGITNIVVNDTDGDGDLEIVWGAGATSSGPDFLYVYDIETQQPEWQSKHIDGPFKALDIANVDQDGQQDIVFASFWSENGYDDGVVFSYDALTYELDWQSPNSSFGSTAWTGIHDLEIGDVDNDGTQDIVIGTDRLYDGAIYIFDGIEKTLKQSYFYDEGASIHSLAIADIDQDGEAEIIAGGRREHSGAPGVYTYVIDGASGNVEWNSINLSGGVVPEVLTANLDEDDALEILSVSDRVYLFDPVANVQHQSDITGVNSIEVLDTNGDGFDEVLVGTDAGAVQILNRQTLANESTVNLGTSPILSLKVYDFDQDGQKELLFGTANQLGIYSFNQSDVVWTLDLDNALAGSNSLEVSDTDGNGFAEIFVGTQDQVLEFEVTDYLSDVDRPLNEITTDNGNNRIRGTEEGDLVRSLGGNDTINAGAGDDIVNAGGGQDRINGGDGNDSLFGSRGQDTIRGENGDDTLDGGEQRDKIFGDLGNDFLTGQRGADTLSGGRGQDSLLGGSGNDSITGGIGADTIEGGDGSDRVIGNSGNDVIIGGAGNDTLSGGSGQDRISGNKGNDMIFGNLGADTLNGNNGADTLMGQAGNDRLNGGADNDVLVGGTGNDFLTGGAGQDTMTGGDGSDIFVYRNNRHGVDVITDFEIGVDALDLRALTDASQFLSANPFEDYIQLIQTGTGTTVRFDTGGDRAANQFVSIVRLNDIVTSDLSSSDFLLI